MTSLRRKEDFDKDLEKCMTLKQVISILKKAPQDKRVKIGFGAPHSYRGYYECLAFTMLGNVTVGDMLLSAEQSLGHTFTGWKGGNFTMGKKTKVYLASRGECGKPLTEKKLLAMLGVEKASVGWVRSNTVVEKKLTKEIEQMEELYESNDPEIAHAKADALLCKIIRDNLGSGGKQLVVLFKSMKKRYG